jgi:hypothetical protein
MEPIKKWFKNHWDEVILVMLISLAILSMLKGMGKI